MAPAPKPELVAMLEDQMGALAPVEVKRLFGGWQFTAHGQPFALVIKGTLYFRVDDALRAELEARGSEPFRYEKQGKTVTVGKYYSAPEEVFDDPDSLEDWTRKALAAEG